MASSPMIRWSMEHGMYALGAPTPRAFDAACLAYNLRDGAAEQITCPSLVCAGQEDGFFAGQPEKLYAALTCPKELQAFPAEDGGEAHCPVRCPEVRVRSHLRLAGRGYARSIAEADGS